MDHLISFGILALSVKFMVIEAGETIYIFSRNYSFCKLCLPFFGIYLKSYFNLYQIFVKDWLLKELNLILLMCYKNNI